MFELIMINAKISTTKLTVMEKITMHIYALIANYLVCMLSKLQFQVTCTILLLSISCPCSSAIPMLNVKQIYHDFKHAKYDRVNDDLVNINWDATFSSKSTDQSSDFFQKSLLDMIYEWMPIRTFCKSTIPLQISNSIEKTSKENKTSSQII